MVRWTDAQYKFAYSMCNPSGPTRRIRRQLSVYFEITMLTPVSHEAVSEAVEKLEHLSASS